MGSKLRLLAWIAVVVAAIAGGLLWFNRQQHTTLRVEDLVIGTGTETQIGSEVTVDYVGTLTDGKVFDSSYSRNKPFTFTLGQGQVIRGWDQGLLGMKVGGKRRLTIPSDLAYGKAGIPHLIPPNSRLIFEVELRNVR